MYYTQNLLDDHQTRITVCIADRVTVLFQGAKQQTSSPRNKSSGSTFSMTVPVVLLRIGDIILSEYKNVLAPVTIVPVLPSRI